VHAWAVTPARVWLHESRYGAVFCTRTDAGPIARDLESRPEFAFFVRPANLEDLFLRLDRPRAA